MPVAQGLTEGGWRRLVFVRLAAIVRPNIVAGVRPLACESVARRARVFACEAPARNLPVARAEKSRSREKIHQIRERRNPLQIGAPHAGGET